jgi:hypothetical protein
MKKRDETPEEIDKQFQSLQTSLVVIRHNINMIRLLAEIGNISNLHEILSRAGTITDLVEGGMYTLAKLRRSS